MSIGIRSGITTPKGKDFSLLLRHDIDFYIGLSKRKKDNGYTLINLKNNKVERLHRIIWMLAYGDIPKGYEIHHLDENKRNNDIDNLLLVDRSAHTTLHMTGKKWPERATKEWRENISRTQRIRFSDPAERDKVRADRLGAKATLISRLRQSIGIRNAIIRRKERV
jgi:hypothetical protein